MEAGSKPSYTEACTSIPGAGAMGGGGGTQHEGVWHEGRKAHGTKVYGRTVHAGWARLPQGTILTIGDVHACAIQMCMLETDVYA